MIIQKIKNSNQKVGYMSTTKNIINFDQLKCQAEMGCAEAQFLLGVYYFLGRKHHNIQREYSEKLILSYVGNDPEYERLSIAVKFAMSNSDSALKLGKCELGIAFQWFEKAAIQNHVEAHEWLALLYREGLGVEQNDNLAYSHILYAAENGGSAEAQYQLAFCYLNAKGTEKNPQQGLEWCRKAAEQKNLNALYLLACCYLDGNGVAKDQTQGLALLNQVAEIDKDIIEDRMMFCLAQAYSNGDGIEQSDTLALSWYEKLAETSSDQALIGEASFQAATCYFDGKGTIADVDHGLPYLYRAWECQHAGAIQRFDNAYLQFTFPTFIGRDDIEQCYQYAYDWLVNAYKERPTEPEVNFGLGVLFLTGKGVVRNRQKAEEYFQKFWDGGEDVIDYRNDHEQNLMFDMAYIIPSKGCFSSGGYLSKCFSVEYKIDAEINPGYILFPSLIMDFYLKNREFDLLRSYALSIRNYPRVFQQPSTHKQFIKIMLQLLEKDEELKQANQELLAKEKELEEIMSMFAHKFRSPLDTIIYNTHHEHQPKLYIQAAQTMRGLLDIFSIISADDIVLIEKLKRDNQGESGLLTVFSKTLDMILLHLLSAQAAEKIQQHYLRYAKKHGLCDAELSYKQWNDDYFELERQLQTEWEQSFAALLSQQVTLEQRLAWLEQRFFKLELQGFEQANIQFKEYGITESFLTILLNEILVNAFKYYSSDTQQPVVLAWAESDSYQVLSCRNPSARHERDRFKGSGKGHTFLSALARKTGSQFTKPKPQDDFVLEFGIANQLLISS